MPHGKAGGFGHSDALNLARLLPIPCPRVTSDGKDVLQSKSMLENVMPCPTQQYSLAGKCSVKVPVDGHHPDSLPEVGRCMASHCRLACHAC